MTYETVATYARTGGLVYFCILFAVVLFYVLRPGARKTFDAAAQIPFKED